MTHLNISTLNRRHFLGCLALSTFTLLTKDLLAPATALAAPERLTDTKNFVERYHIFVPFTTARNGGTQTFTLRSGNSCQVEIPAKTQDSQEITIKGRGEEGKDIIVVLHTLYDRQIRIADQIYQEIDKNTQFVQSASKVKCKSVYEQLEDGEYINDLIALDFLDYVIASSKLESQIRDRYKLASTNSRLLGSDAFLRISTKFQSANEADKFHKSLHWSCELN